MKTKILFVLVIGIALVLVTNQSWAGQSRIIHLEDVAPEGNMHGQASIHEFNTNSYMGEGHIYLDLTTHGLRGCGYDCNAELFYSIYITTPSLGTFRAFNFNPSSMLIGYSVKWIGLPPFEELFKEDITIEVRKEWDDGEDSPASDVVLRGTDDGDVGDLDITGTWNMLNIWLEQTCPTQEPAEIFENAQFIQNDSGVTYCEEWEGEVECMPTMPLNGRNFSFEGSSGSESFSWEGTFVDNYTLVSQSTHTEEQDGVLCTTVADRLAYKHAPFGNLSGTWQVFNGYWDTFGGRGTLIEPMVVTHTGDQMTVCTLDGAECAGPLTITGNVVEGTFATPGCSAGTSTLSEFVVVNDNAMTGYVSGWCDGCYSESAVTITR